MSNKKKNIDYKEVDEIIDLKLNQLSGVTSKLNYNNVWEFNKLLVKERTLRNNGQYFNLYGYTFWASNYKDEDYYGKKKIDEIQSGNGVIPAGEKYVIGVEDIFILIDKYKRNPEVLKHKISKIFIKERRKLEEYKRSYIEVNKNLDQERKEKEKFIESFFTLFYNSMYSNNSLDDITNLRRVADNHIGNELVNMFSAKDIKELNTYKSILREDGVIDLSLIKANKKKLETLL